VEHVAKEFPAKGGAVAALTDVSFEVGENEIFGLLGPNGAGKSTTMSILATLIGASAGRAVVAGFDVDEDPIAVRRLLGVALQETGLDPLQTGRETLELHGKLWGRSAVSAQDRAGELLEMLGLEEAGDRRIGGYSGGMRRRLDLATVLVHRPPILILDEPTTGLDVASRQAVWAELRRTRDAGATILFSTQDLDEAERWADRAAIIGDGRVLGVGSPAEFTQQLGAPDAVVTFATADDADRLCRVLNVIRQGPVEVAFELVEPWDDFSDLLRAIEKEGLAVVSLDVNHPSLEHAFLKLTAPEARRHDR
jgi:ABC-2 type transport system ATP-binding protein